MCVAGPATSGGDDAELVRAALAGDATAEERLYRRHARHVFDIVARMVGRRDAEDVLQDVFVIVLERLDQLRDPSSFRAWVVRTAVREVYRRGRKRRLLARLGFGDHAAEILLEPSRELSPEQRAQLAELAEVLRRVPVDRRICWMLRHVEGFRLEEVAAAVGCSLATVKRRLVEVDAAIAQRVAP